MQLYVWQIPVNLLNVSIMLFLIGLTIHIFTMAFTRDSKTWTDDKKVGVRPDSWSDDPLKQHRSW